MTKLRHSNVKQSAHDHRTNKWQNQDLDVGHGKLVLVIPIPWKVWLSISCLGCPRQVGFSMFTLSLGVGEIGRKSGSLFLESQYPGKKQI
jgi:hypothetical protein